MWFTCGHAHTAPTSTTTELADAQNRHHLVMDVTLAEAIEPETTALGRSIRETDRMVIRSMMEAVKDPVFNQALNSILDTTKPRGRKTAHCLIFICSKLHGNRDICTNLHDDASIPVCAPTVDRVSVNLW